MNELLLATIASSGSGPDRLYPAPESGLTMSDLQFPTYESIRGRPLIDCRRQD